MNRAVRSLAVLAAACALSLPGAASADASAHDAVTATLLDPFMQALLVPEVGASAKATLPFVHKSLMNDAGDDLAPDLKRFSFKKAHENARLYATPVKVARVSPTGITSVGAGGTLESGAVVDYFVEKKSGAGASPIRVFIPQAGGPMKVAYMGSL